MKKFFAIIFCILISACSIPSIAMAENRDYNCKIQSTAENNSCDKTAKDKTSNIKTIYNKTENDKISDNKTASRKTTGDITTSSKTSDDSATSGESDISVDEAIDELLDGIDLNGLENFFDNYISGYVTNKGFKDFFKDILSGKSISYHELFSGIFALLKDSLLGIVGVFGCVIAIIIICGIISSLSTEKNGTGEIVFAVCYAAICLVLLVEIGTALKKTANVIKDINLQTQAVFPLLLTLVSISGGSLSGEIYKPVCVFLSSGIMSVISKVLMPLLSGITVISAISSLSDKYSLKNLHSFLCDCFKWGIGGMVGIFTFFTALNGITAAGLDGVSIRALKWTVGQSVPIIGNFAKQGVDVFLAAGMLIKNAAGSVILIILFCALFTPFLRLLLLSLCLKLLAAIAEPISDGRICQLINAFAKVVGLAAALAITVFILYFLTIIIIISVQSAAIL